MNENGDDDDDDGDDVYLSLQQEGLSTITNKIGE